MIKKYTHKSITWIDAENPTNEEIKSLVEEYGISLDIAKDLHLPINKNYKERVTIYKDYIYMIMRFPAFRHSHTKDVYQEIDFVVGKDFIITTRYETIDALERFAKFFEVNSTLGKHIMEDNAGYVLYYIIKELYLFVADEIDHINDALKTTEDNIFKGNEKKTVFDISLVNRDLINLNHIILSHKDILKGVKEVGGKLFGKEFPDHFDIILHEYYRIENLLISNIDFLKELRNTNDSLLSLKQNETMKHLTMMAFVTFPLTLLTSVFAMETKYKIIVGMDYDFLIIIGIMITTALGFFVFFKYKKWL